MGTTGEGPLSWGPLTVALKPPVKFLVCETAVGGIRGERAALGPSESLKANRGEPVVPCLGGVRERSDVEGRRARRRCGTR